MPRNMPTQGSAFDWPARAKGDLALARIALPEGGFYEDLCFHAQQTAEKALKAVYLSRGWPFRHTHDLEELVHGLQHQGLAVPEDVKRAFILTIYASEARYPGIGDPVTPDEHAEAVALAQAYCSGPQA
jgi:HEPN domain-containing protein